MNLAEFVNAETGEPVYIAPEIVGAIAPSDRGTLVMLKTGVAFHVVGQVEGVVRALHQAQQQPWTPPVEAERVERKPEAGR